MGGNKEGCLPTTQSFCNLIYNTLEKHGAKIVLFSDIYKFFDGNLVLICTFLVIKTDIYLQMSQKISNFAAKLTKKDNKMAITTFEKLQQMVERMGVVVTNEQERFYIYHEDILYPFLLIVFCHQGSARVLYDQVEMAHNKNEIAVVMPGHIVRQLECSDDYVFTRVAISKEMLSYLQSQAFSHDYEKFHLTPVCQLNDEQAKHLLSIADLLGAVARHDYEDLSLRQQMLISLLSVGYEFLNYYRREIDKQLPPDKNTRLFNQFCALVVEHYRESKEVKFYADLLHISPRHFTRIFHDITNGMTPSGWIEQYVVTQAKLLIDTQKERSIKEISYLLGFPEPSSFHHFFKRVTGMTTKDYCKQLASSVTTDKL